MLLGEIDALSKATGWCDASRAHFAEWLQCSPQNVTYYLSKLQRLGFIEQVEQPGYRTKRRVVNARFYEQEGVKGSDRGGKGDFPGGVKGVSPGGKGGLPEIQGEIELLNTKENNIPADAENDPSHAVVIFEENEPVIVEPVYLNVSKKKPKSTGREKSDGSGSWTRKIAELFDRVEAEESQRAGIQSVPFAWQMNAGRNFSVLKIIRQQIEKDVAAKQARPATEEEVMTGFEAMFRFGFRYLNDIAQNKGGLPQYSPATILNNYSSIKRYATSSNKNRNGRTAEFYRSAAEIDLGID